MFQQSEIYPGVTVFGLFEHSFDSLNIPVNKSTGLGKVLISCSNGELPSFAKSLNSALLKGMLSATTVLGNSCLENTACTTFMVVPAVSEDAEITSGYLEK